MRAEWQRNPAARRFDLSVFPILAVLFIGGFAVAITSAGYHGVGQVVAALSLFLTVAINYAVRRPRKER